MRLILREKSYKRRFTAKAMIAVLHDLMILRDTICKSPALLARRRRRRRRRHHPSQTFSPSKNATPTSVEAKVARLAADAAGRGEVTWEKEWSGQQQHRGQERTEQTYVCILTLPLHGPSCCFHSPTDPLTQPPFCPLQNLVLLIEGSEYLVLCWLAELRMLCVRRR